MTPGMQAIAKSERDYKAMTDETDRELLELAAKAGGLRLNYEGHITDGNYYDISLLQWNPLEDDGDALRLAVKLGMSKVLELDIGPGGMTVTFHHPMSCADEFTPLEGGFDPYAATRRAIVTAAAMLGKAMP